MMKGIMPTPCVACPYKKDVPSGVWAEEEYDKLPLYDAETPAQPFEPFACHAAPDHYCHGWAVCHSNRGRPFELISLRLAGVTDIPDAGVPLFSSGQEASDHGKRNIERPGEDARLTQERLLKRHARLKMKEN